MGLQIWLPLRGSNENIGLAREYKYASSTASLSNSGGIFGTCVVFTATTGNGIYFSDNNFMANYINNHSFTLCAWVKSTSTDTIVISLSYGLRMFAGTTPLVYLYNSTRTVGAANSTSTTDGKWHHLAATYDVTTGLITMYVDGEGGTPSQYPTGSTYSSSWNNGLYIGRDPNNSTANAHYFFQGSLNDVRIYDECLSAKEISEISKGLSLHYKLTDETTESTTNLSSLSSRSGWNNSGNATRSYDKTTVTGAPFGQDAYSIYQTSAGDQCFTFGYTSCSGSTTYACSCYVYVTDTFTAGASFYIRSVANNNTSKDCVGKLEYNGSSDVSTWPKKQWIRISKVVTTESNETQIYFCKYIDTLYELNAACAWQIELKDHVTPYVNGTRSGLLIQDCSGYGNEGTPYGTIEVTPDSGAMYGKYSQFNGSDNSIYIGNLTSLCDGSNFSMNCWFYHDSNWSSKAWETIFGGPSGFELEMKSSSTNSPLLYAYSWGKATAAYTLNEWHMLTMVRTTASTAFYIDGALAITGSTGSIPSGNYYIGSWSTSAGQNYRGRVSDFRVYSTALSSDYIQELYQERASVCDNDNFMVNKIEETGSGNLAILTNKAIADKLCGNGLSSYEQTNCTVTLDGETYYIYRPANLTYDYTSATRTMWGGFVLDNGDSNRFGFTSGHSYSLQFSISGQSSNHPEYYWTNLVGWGGGGLEPSPTSINITNPLASKTTTDGWENFEFSWTINDGVYKVCTSSYYYFSAGTTYMSYKGFKFGWTYQDTGELGTKVYLKNIQLYDITDGTKKLVKILQDGITDCTSIIEHDGITRFLTEGNVLTNKIIEN